MSNYNSIPRQLTSDNVYIMNYWETCGCWSEILLHCYITMLDSMANQKELNYQFNSIQWLNLKKKKPNVKVMNKKTKKFIAHKTYNRKLREHSESIITWENGTGPSEQASFKTYNKAFLISGSESNSCHRYDRSNFCQLANF